MASINAGTNIITSGSAVILIADGSSNIISYKWTQLSGPTTASITTPNGKSTAVIFTESGYYRFKVTGTYRSWWGRRTVSDAVTVNVSLDETSTTSTTSTTQSTQAPTSSTTSTTTTKPPTTTTTSTTKPPTTSTTTTSTTKPPTTTTTTTKAPTTSTTTTTAGVPGTRANLIFESTFEKVVDWTVFNLPVDKGTAWTNAQTCCALNSLSGAPISRAGSKAAMFTLRKSDPLVSGSLRSEITGPEESTFGTTRWYAFSIYLPDGFTPDNTALLVAQWHSSSFNTVPPLKLILENSGWSIVNTSTGNGNSVGDDYHGIGSYSTGVWTDFVIKVLWNNTTSGQLQVWKNGTSVFNSTSIKTSYTGGTYFKTGIYGYGWGAGQGSTNPPPYVVYIDEWREGNENATYNDVKPG